MLGPQKGKAAQKTALRNGIQFPETQSSPRACWASLPPADLQAEVWSPDWFLPQVKAASPTQKEERPGSQVRAALATMHRTEGSGERK